MLAEFVDCGGGVSYEIDQREALLMTLRDMGNGVRRVEQVSWMPAGAGFAGEAVLPSLPAFLRDAAEHVSGRALDNPSAQCRFVSDGIIEYLIVG